MMRWYCSLVGATTVSSLFALGPAVDEIAFFRSYPDIMSRMNMHHVYQHLVQNRALSTGDHNDLVNIADSRMKMEKLLAVLPRNGPGFLTRFINCLRQSCDGTAHDELASILEEAQSKARIEWRQNRTGGSIQHDSTEDTSGNKCAN